MNGTWMATLAQPPATADQLWTWAGYAARAEVLGAGPPCRDAIAAQVARLGTSLDALAPGVTTQLRDLETASGTRLAELLVIIQDAALLSGCVGDLLTDAARRSIQAWTEDAEGVMLDHDAADALDVFLGTSPLPDALRIGPLVAPLPAAERLLAIQLVSLHLAPRRTIMAAIRQTTQPLEHHMTKIVQFAHHTWQQILGDAFTPPSLPAVMAIGALGKSDQEELSIPRIPVTLHLTGAQPFKIKLARTLHDRKAGPDSQILALEITSDLPVEAVVLFDIGDSGAKGDFFMVARKGEAAIDANKLKQRIENDDGGIHFKRRDQGDRAIFELDIINDYKHLKASDVRLLKYGHYAVQFKGGICFVFDLYKDK